MPFSEHKQTLEECGGNKNENRFVIYDLWMAVTVHERVMMMRIEWFISFDRIVINTVRSFDSKR